MEEIKFNKLLLKTAFACMACDGNIDKREVLLIKRVHDERKAFGNIDIEKELEELLLSVNNEGQTFFLEFFKELSNNEFTEDEELKLIKAAIETIKADENVEYSEIKFLKVIRSKLKIKNELILEKHPDFEEYLEQDILSDSYLARLQYDFFNINATNKFELTSLIDDSLLKKIKEQDGEES